ncbi:MAG: hypothetical protein K9M15_02975 [Candidatus Marinimicrobia bacterium]|nr:hypothetical protein [Candidatus Neomarinimicrobiota bacterium]
MEELKRNFVPATISVLVGCLLALAILYLACPVNAAEKEEMKKLVEFAVVAVPPQQGPGSSAMWVLAAKGLELPGHQGYRNIFLRIHDGGNRMVVSLYYKTIRMYQEKTIVTSVKFVDGGSLLGIFDEDNNIGPPDGKPDKIFISQTTLSPDGEILELGEEKPIASRSPEILKLFSEGIQEVITECQKMMI